MNAPLTFPALFNRLSCALLAALFLAGCGTTGTQSEAERPTTPPTPATTSAADAPSERESRGEPDPTTLLLSWQRDPTSTMTIQWLERGEELPLASGLSETPPQGHRVPRLDNAALDPGAAWNGHALEVPRLTNEAHRVPNEEMFGAGLKLGWSDEGLRVRIDVLDLTPNEQATLDQLWMGDAVELFVSTGVGEEQRYQLVVSPGSTDEHPEPRMRVYDLREEEEQGEIDATYDAAVREDGYTLEVLLPWQNLGIETVEPGMELGFQAIVNDNQAGERVGDVSWHPARNSAASAEAMMPLRLAEEADPPVRVRVVDGVDEQDRHTVRVLGDRELTGQLVTVHAGDEALGGAQMAEHDPLVEAAIAVPAPPEGYRWGTLEVRLEGERIGSVTAPPGFYSPMPDPAHLTYSLAGQSDPQQVETEVSRVRDWPGGMFRQRVELTGLEPATEYAFQIPGTDRAFYFRTMPTDTREPIRFAVGGDIRHQQDWMEATNRQAMRYDPDFVVWGGDFAYANARPDEIGKWEEWFEANYNTLIAEDGRVIPIIGAIGNHEVRGAYVGTRDDFDGSDAFRLEYAPFFYQLLPFPGQPGYGVLDFGDYLSLVILDTDHTNPIDGEQISWLEQTLEERQHVPHVIPVYHVPAYPSVRGYEGGPNQRVREHWVPLFEQYGVAMAFENHDHAYKRTRPIRGGEVDEQGVVYIGDGAWGVSVRPIRDPDAWYLEKAQSIRHAIIVTLQGEERDIVVVSEDGDVIDEFSLTEEVSLTDE